MTSSRSLSSSADHPPRLLTTLRNMCHLHTTKSEVSQVLTAAGVAKTKLIAVSLPEVEGAGCRNCQLFQRRKSRCTNIEAMTK